MNTLELKAELEFKKCLIEEMRGSRQDIEDEATMDELNDSITCLGLEIDEIVDDIYDLENPE